MTTKPHPKLRFRPLANHASRAVPLLLLLVAVPAVPAAEFLWNNTATGGAAKPWSTTGSWVGGVAPDEADAWVRLNNVSITAGQTMTLGTTVYEIGRLDIGTASGAGRMTLEAGTGGGLHFTGYRGGPSQLRQVATTAPAGNLVTAPITTSSDLTIYNDSSEVFQLRGSITAAGSGTKWLEFSGAGTGSTNVTGIIADGDAQAQIALRKTSTGTLSLQSANTFTGPVVIERGNLDLRSAGSLLAAQDVIVRNAQITHYNTTDNIQRLNSAVNLTLEAGSLNFSRATGSGSFELAANKIILNSGVNRLQLTGYGVSLRVQTLERQERSTALIRGASIGQGGAGNLIFTVKNLPTGSLIGGGGAAGSTTLSILPYLIAESNTSNGSPGTDLLTAVYNSDNDTYSIRTLTSAEYLGTGSGSSSAIQHLDISSANPAANARLNAYAATTSATVSGGTVNSLTLLQTSATNPVFTLQDTVEIRSGQILIGRSGGTAQSTTIQGGTIRFAASDSATERKEGIIHASTGSDVVISSRIRGSGGVTFATYNDNTLIRLTSNENDYLGTTTVNGRLEIGVDQALPQTTRVHVATGGDLNVAGHALAIAGLEGKGSVSLGSDATLLVETDTNDATFDGTLTGTGGTLTKRGAAAQHFSGTLAHTGTTVVEAGAWMVDGRHENAQAYTVNNGGALGGTGLIALAGGESIDVDGGGRIIAGSGAALDTLHLKSPSGPALSLATDARILFTLGDALGSSRLDIESDAGLAFNSTIFDFNNISTDGLAEGDYLLITLSTGSTYSGLTLDDDGRVLGGLSIGTGLAGYDGAFHVQGENLYITVTQAIPETSSLWLMGAGLLTTVCTVRRRNR